jgi:hypothetical protein
MEKREAKGAKKSKKKTFESQKASTTKEDDGLSRKQRAELKKEKKAPKKESPNSSPQSSPKGSPTTKTKTLTKKQLKRQVGAQNVQ